MSHTLPRYQILPLTISLSFIPSYSVLDLEIVVYVFHKVGYLFDRSLSSEHDSNYTVIMIGRYLYYVI